MIGFADRMLDRFTEWFCSKGGVWQTAILTLAVVAVEVADRSLDPHAFVLMAVLTVYSAITQPALAYSGATQARKMELVLAQLEKAEADNAALLARLAALMDHQGVPPMTGET